MHSLKWAAKRVAEVASACEASPLPPTGITSPLVYSIGFLDTTFYMLYFVWPVGPRVHLFALIVSFLVIPNADSITSSIYIFFRTF